MTRTGLLARSLLYYRAVHCAVALGVGVGVAVLAGALIVGSSVRGSLRDLTLDRLGAIDFAVVGERYFRETVAGDAQWAGRAASGVLIRGSAENAASGARAAKVRIHGVDEAFWEFYGLPEPSLGIREVAINRRLSGELGAAQGDDILLRFHTDTMVPAETVMGRKSDNVRLMRLRVASILEDEGPGRFGLSPQQQLPYNAFVNQGVLQRALEHQGRTNALFISGGTLESAKAAWREEFSAEDARLAIRALGGHRELLVESERIVLAPAEADAIHEAAAASGLNSTEVLTYLANSISTNGRTVPYSTVSALQSLPDSLRLTDGAAAKLPRDGEILLNAWTGTDLRAGLGDRVSLTYYVVGPGSKLATSSQEFRLAGLVDMAGAALDRDFAPSYKGMSDKSRMSSWDPPFPMDLRLIRPKDERYWELYRAAPKAFVSLSTAKQLWTSRFGQLTSIRLQPPEGELSEPVIGRFREELRRRLDPAEFGLAIQPVKRAGLAASSGATDFAGLFVGFSLFLIASAAILVALLFRLGVERRAHEIGALLATGLSPRLVRRLLFAEGAVLAGAGCLVGIPGAVAYAKLMLYGLSTWWSGAIGGSFLELHVSPRDPMIGALAAVATMLVTIWLSLRRLVRLSPNALLSGRVEPSLGVIGHERRGRRLRRIAAAITLTAAALLGLSFGVDSASRLGAFFGAGTLSLAAALIYLRASLLTPNRGEEVVSGIARLGIRNGGRNPTRSVLSVALVACASFMIVTVAMNRHDVSTKEPAFESGDGGFRLVADVEVPLFQDRIDEVEREQSAAMRIFPLRVRAGEDASCLNLYQPTQPTLVGAPDSVIERGGFAFQQTLAETEAEKQNPWLLLEKDFGEAIPVFGDANSVTWILHLGLGDKLLVRDSAGRERSLLLAGLLSRSIFQSELVLSEGRFLELHPDHSGFQSLLVETEAGGASEALEHAFADNGLDAVRTADRLAGYLVVENTYLSTFRTLGGLGLLLGTLGLAVVMVRTVLERRSELALLEALGFARQGISRLIFAENSFLLVLGVGIGAASALIAVGPSLASGASDPPWLPLALTLGAIVGLGLLAGGAAAALSLRTPLLANLRRD